MIRYSETVKNWVGDRIGFVPEPCHGLEILHEEETVGGILYWHFQYDQGVLCDTEISMALDRPQSLTKRVLDIMLRYPFEGLKTERLTARIDVNNERSARIARKLGMKEEGIIRRGRFPDHRLFGILRSEWNGWIS